MPNRAVCRQSILQQPQQGQLSLGAASCKQQSMGAAKQGLTRCQSRGWLLLLLPPPLAVEAKGSLVLT